MEKDKKFKVAVVQAGSEIMDKEKGVLKTVRLIEEAGAQGS